MQSVRPHANRAVWLLLPIAVVVTISWWPRDEWPRPWLWLPIPLLALFSNLVWPQSKSLKVTAIIALCLFTTFLPISAHSDIERRYRSVTVLHGNGEDTTKEAIRILGDTRQIAYETFNGMVFGYAVALIFTAMPADLLSRLGRRDQPPPLH